MLQQHGFCDVAFLLAGRVRSVFLCRRHIVDMQSGRVIGKAVGTRKHALAAHVHRVELRQSGKLLEIDVVRVLKKKVILGDHRYDDIVGIAWASRGVCFPYFFAQPRCIRDDPVNVAHMGDHVLSNELKGGDGQDDDQGQRKVSSVVRDAARLRISQ
ncbi:MAG: hypothetical protein H7840_00030 [Alphaproteobacteria bacterium]